MDSMVERVARVLLAHDPNMQALKRINSKHYDSTMDDEWVNLIPEAKAAINAMTEPTPVEAGLREAAIALRDDMLMRAEMNKPFYGGDLVVEAGAGVWARFTTILAALSETPPSQEGTI